MNKPFIRVPKHNARIERAKRSLLRSNFVPGRPGFYGLVVAAIFVPLVAAAQTGCLSGNVIDNTGAPVPGIRVTVGDNVWTTAQISPEPRSDEAGQFRIEGIPPGEYNANAFNDQLGYPGIWWPVRKVFITDSPICTNITFNVRSRTAKLKLTVTDGTTGRPVKDILVDVSQGNGPGLWLHVEPLLSYGLPPQVPSLTKLRIVVTAKGYSASKFMFASLAPGATQEITTTLFPKRLGCITGVAVDDSLAPVILAKINPRFMGPASGGDVPSTATTDNSGIFTLDNLRPGDYTLYPEKESDGFPGLWSGWQGQVALQKVTVTPGGVCQEVTVNMGARGALIRVHAMDGTTHQLLLKVSLSFRNSENMRQGGTVMSAPGELHELMIPSRSNVNIQVRAEGYRPSEQIPVGPLSPGETQDLTVSLQREADSSPVGERIQ